MINNWQSLRGKQKPWDTYLLKSRLFKLVRDYFWQQGFTEFDVPILNTSYPVEPNIFLSPVTWQQKHQQFFLAPSPESSMKKILGAGFSQNIFTISKCVRDLEDLGPTHNLEFSMLEWYEPHKSYTDVATTTQNLFNYLLSNLFPGENKLEYFDKIIDFGAWQTTTVKELFAKYAQLNLDENLSFASIQKTAQSKGYNTQGVTVWEPLFDQIWLNEIEPHLRDYTTPLLVYDFPLRLSTLCQPTSDHLYGKRWELYISGIEFANCYQELTDPSTQQQNFNAEVDYRNSLGQPSHPIDTDMLSALSTMPPTSGIAIGLDRLAMLFANTKDISDVILFPTKEMVK